MLEHNKYTRYKYTTYFIFDKLNEVYMKKFLSIVAFFLIYNNFILANDYKKINEVAKKIYVQLKNNCPSEELECLNLSEKEINDLQNMLNIKLAVLEKNALRSRLMKITKYSSTFILSIFWIYLPLIQFLKDCHDDECNHELLLYFCPKQYLQNLLIYQR